VSRSGWLPGPGIGGFDQLTHEMAILKRWKFARRSEQLNPARRRLIHHRIMDNVGSPDAYIRYANVGPLVRFATSWFHGSIHVRVRRFPDSLSPTPVLRLGCCTDIRFLCRRTWHHQDLRQRSLGSQPHDADRASPMISALSLSLSHGISSVNMVMHWCQEQGILVMSVPQNMRCGPKAS